MGFKLMEAWVEIGAKMEPLDRGLSAAKAKVLGAIRGINSAAGAVGISLGAAGISAGLYKAAMAAADLGESVSKTQQVFGGAFGGIRREVDRLADSYGTVKKDALDAASGFGLLAQAAGLSKAASADMSAQFVRLAVDAESFFNVPLTVALEKIHSGLVGEAEPMRAFGVLLNEDAVKAEALRMGLTHNAKALTDQMKVMARASLIVKGMTTALGDKERTLGSLSNQMKKFKGDLKNFETDFGESMIYPLSEAIKLLREFNDVFKTVTGGTKGENIGEFIGGTLAGIQNVMAAGRKGFANPDQYMMGGLGQFGKILSGIMAANVHALFPNQDFADQLAGVQKGGKAPPKPPPTFAEKFANNPLFQAMQGANAARAEQQKKQGEIAAYYLRTPLQNGLGVLADLKQRGLAVLSQGINTFVEANRGSIEKQERKEAGISDYRPQFMEGGLDYHRMVQEQILGKGTEQKEIAAATKKSAEILENLFKAFVDTAKRAPGAAFGKP